MGVGVVCFHIHVPVIDVLHINFDYSNSAINMFMCLLLCNNFIAIVYPQLRNKFIVMFNLNAVQLN